MGFPPEIADHQNDDDDDCPNPSILALHVFLRVLFAPTGLFYIE
jgi:hypothetical protein